MQFSVIVFDTAPTGHTLRFLSFPTVLEKALGKLSTLSGRFGPMLNQVSCQSSSNRRQLISFLAHQVSSMMGGGVNTSEMFEKLESMRAVVTEVNQQFKNPDLTTFIPVMSALSTGGPLRLPDPLMSTLAHSLRVPVAV